MAVGVFSSTAWSENLANTVETVETSLESNFLDMLKFQALSDLVLRRLERSEQAFDLVQRRRI